MGGRNSVPDNRLRKSTPADATLNKYPNLSVKVALQIVEKKEDDLVIISFADCYSHI